MKTCFKWIAVLFAIALIVPLAIAEEQDEKNSDEPIIKRIFVRDGEVIEIDGDHEIEWSPAGVIVPGKRTFLGVNVVDISEDLRAYFRAPGDRGVLVSQVEKDTPADKAGLKAGDVIVGIDGKTIDSSGDLRRTIRDHEGNDSIEIEIIRSGAPQKIFATLAEREMKLPRIHLRNNGEGFRYRIDRSDESLKKLNEFFESQDWKTRVLKMQDCFETQQKLDAMQKRLNELEKKLEKMN